MTGHATLEDLYARFEDLGLDTTTHTHHAVFTVEDAKATRDQVPGMHCKNLFLRDAKKQYWLVVAPADLPLDMKALAPVIGSKRLSFGSPERLKEVLGVVPGSVTPFALINDEDRQVNVVLDRTMMDQEMVSYHPLTNTATTALTPEALLVFIRSCGHDPKIVDLTQARGTDP